MPNFTDIYVKSSVNTNVMNRFKHFILTAMVSIGIISCTKSDKLSLYIMFDSVRNLREGSEVYRKNIQIGEVTDLRLGEDHKILVKIDLDSSFIPVKQDTFALVNRDYFGSQAVEVISGDGSGERYRNGDTVVGILFDREPLLRMDSVTWKIARDSLIGPYISK